jgi:hypothetical protein
MAEKGLRNDSGNKIVKSRLHEYLTDPFYIGKNVWNNKEYHGNQETFIDVDTFNKVQQIMQSKGTPKYRKHSFIFQGMIRCDECGGLITWEVHKGITYGHCNHYKNCSQTVWYKELEVQELLVQKLKDLQIINLKMFEWVKKALKDGHKDKVDYYQASVTELNKRKQQLNNRLENMYIDKLDEKITPVFYETQSSIFKKELDQIEQTLSKHNNATQKYNDLGNNLYELSQRSQEIFNKATNEDKRILINLVFSQLKLGNGEIKAQYTKAFTILSELIKLTNSSKVEKNMVMKNKTFELDKQTEIAIQMQYFSAARPVLLPREDSNLEP